MEKESGHDWLGGGLDTLLSCRQCCLCAAPTLVLLMGKKEVSRGLSGWVWSGKQCWWLGPNRSAPIWVVGRQRIRTDCHRLRCPVLTRSSGTKRVRNGKNECLLRPEATVFGSSADSICTAKLSDVILCGFTTFVRCSNGICWHW